MAAQVNNVHPFVSSNAYYGYLPVNHQQQQPQQQQQKNQINHDLGMDVDNESFAKIHNNSSNNVMQQKQPQQTHERHEFVMSVDEGHRHWSQGRKRGFDRDEVANYMPCFKRFRDGNGNKHIFHGTGDYLWTEDGRLAKVYHEPLLCLSPAADSDMVYQETAVMGNFKIQPITSSKTNNTRSQELEDMLLLTHGCSFYHHMSQTGDNEEAEF